MSYCRFSEDSDVYMYLSQNGIECCGCSLYPGFGQDFDSAELAMAHLREHQDVGHRVPEYAFEKLKYDAARGLK